MVRQIGRDRARSGKRSNIRRPKTTLDCDPGQGLCCGLEVGAVLIACVRAMHIDPAVLPRFEHGLVHVEGWLISSQVDRDEGPQICHSDRE